MTASRALGIFLGVVALVVFLGVLFTFAVINITQNMQPLQVPGFDSLAFVITISCLIPVAIVLLKRKMGKKIDQSS